MNLFTFVIYISLAALGVSFALLNASPVVLNYYLGAREVPLSLVVISFLAIGVVLGLLSNAFTIIKLKFSNKSLQKRLQGAEKELSKLKSSAEIKELI